MAGDVLTPLPGLIRQAPAEAALCVYHTHVTYQLSKAERAELNAILVGASVVRPSFRLGCEGSRVDTRRRLTQYRHREQIEDLLDLAAGHASWLEWRAELTSD